MIWQNKIDVHNVETFIPGEHGDSISRLPVDVVGKLARQDQSYSWTGVELRFVLTAGDRATVRIYCPDTDMAMNRACMLYHGNHQSGWTWLHCLQIHPGMNEITCALPENIEQLESLSHKYGHRFSARVFRLVMPGGAYELCGIDGDVRPPRADEIPEKYGVFYGSSITNGSLSQNPSSCFVSICGHRLGVDTVNKGLAGSCYMEPALTGWLLSRYPDAAFFCVEVGTNCYGAISDDELRQRLEYMLNTFSATASDRPLFVIDCISRNAHHDGCRRLVSEILRQNTDPCVHYIPGDELIPDHSLYAADGVHPSIDGHIMIADNLTKAIQKHI